MSDGSIKFAAVGDITLGDHPMCAGFGAYSRFKDLAPTYPFQHVSSELAKADLLFGNLECSFMEAPREHSYRTLQMRAHKKHVEGLKKTGFKVLNLANNHTMQHGNGPFAETRALLDENGIICCGLNRSSVHSCKPAFFVSKGVRVGLLGYSVRPRQYFTHAPLYAEGDPDSMAADLKDLKKKADTAIVSVHWGDEFIPEPSPEEVRTGRMLIDAGADLVIGHHPHVLRAVERYKKGVIAYSLGNFVCDMAWDKRLRESLIFKCRITKAGVSEVELVPVYINDKFQPELLNGNDAEKLLSMINELSLAASASAPETMDPSEYLKKADAFQKLYRSKSHRFFLSNIYRFPAGILFQQFFTYFRNRADEAQKLLTGAK